MATRASKDERRTGGAREGHDAGLVLAAVLAGGAEDAGVASSLACLAPMLRRRCAAALEELARLPQKKRRQRVQRLTLRVLSPLPPEIERVEPERLEAALAEQPPALARLASEVLPDSVGPRVAAALGLPAAERRASGPQGLGLRWRLCQQLLAALPRHDDQQGERQ